jgi:hypothetical protein
MIITAKEARKLAHTAQHTWKSNNFTQLVNATIPQLARDGKTDTLIILNNYSEEHIEMLISAGFTITPTDLYHGPEYPLSSLSWA